jgi:hypothetical protein
MSLKRFAGAATALALILSPTVAAAQTAAAATSAVSQQAVQPEAETAEGSELRRTGIIIPLAALLLIGLLIYLLTKKGDDKEPRSP